MQKYFFNLGRNPTLSASEIFSVLKKLQISATPYIFSEEVLVITVNNPLDAIGMNKILGGSVKIGQVFDEIGMEEDESKFNYIFSSENLLANYIPLKSGKIHFGVSIYNGGSSIQYVAQLERQLKNINKLIKENLKIAGLKAGFVQIKDRFLSSVSVAKNNLLDHGAEIVLILSTDKIMVGKTLAVQEFEEFSRRDFDRPRKDKKSGIMPPKLARMMINIAEPDKNEVMLDPFCGSGTVIGEAIYMGFRNIIGSDISRRAIEDSKENINWIFANFQHLKLIDYNLKIFESDVRRLRELISPNSVHSIITEPFLGPSLHRMPEENRIRSVFMDLERLYLDAFKTFSEIMVTHGNIVIIFPAFILNGRMISMQIVEQIKSLGFRQLGLMPDDISNSSMLKITHRNTIIYGSRDQFVIREIIKFEKI